MINRLKSADTWIGALVAATLAAALYLIQAATGAAPEPPELVEDFVEVLSTDIFGETTPGDLVEDDAGESGADVSDEAPADGSGK